MKRHDQTIKRATPERKAEAPPLPPPWAISRGLTVILLAAALFRGIYFYLYGRSGVFFDNPILDSKVYDTWATSIAGGALIGRQAFYFPPLYPYVMALLFKVGGHSLPAIYLMQSLLGLLNLALIHRIGMAIFNERVGLLAAAGAALYGPFAFFEMKILGVTIGLTLSLAALALLVGAERASLGGREAAARWHLAGLAIGLAAECVPGTILVAPVYAAYLGFGRMRAALLLLAGTILATLPVMAHNLYVASDPLPLSGQGGITFYQGNNPTASGFYGQAPGFTGSPESQAVEEQSRAEKETGRIMRRSEVSAHFLGKGLAYIASSPLAWLVLEGRKLLALAGEYEASTEYSLYFERAEVPLLRVLFLPYAVILGAGVAGMVLAGRPRPPAIALFLYTLCAAAVPMLFYVSSRYRLPIVPPLLIYGASLCDRAIVAYRSAEGFDTPLTRAAAVALGIALVSFFPLGRPLVSAEANVFYNVGNLSLEKKKYDEAIGFYDRSLAQWPGNGYAWINRGNALDKLGRSDEALSSYESAAQAEPGLWLAYKAQGILLHRDKRYEEEAAAYRRGIRTDGEEAYYLLGIALKNLQRTDEAIRALREAVRINPSYARAHTRLGELLSIGGDDAAAHEEFRKALSFDPADTSAAAGFKRTGG